MNTELRYVPVALYTFGVCYYGFYDHPHRTVKVEADSMEEATQKARKELLPSAVESVCWVTTEPNPRYREEAIEETLSTEGTRHGTA